MQLAFARCLVVLDLIGLGLRRILLRVVEVLLQGNGQCQIGRGLREQGLQFQRMSIGGDGLIELVAPGIDVAEVKVSGRGVQLRKAGDGQVVIHRVIGGDALPVRGAKGCGGFGEVLVLEGPAPLLIRGEERIGQRAGLSRGGVHGDAQRHYKKQHPADPVQTPALAQAEERNQQQRPTQPITGVFPVQFTLLVAGGFEMALGMQFDPVQVVIIEGQAAQRRVGGLCQLLECVGVEATQLRAAIAVGARLAGGITNHPALFAADGQHQYLQLAVVQLLVEGGELRRVGPVGHQHQGAWGFLGEQQTLGLIDDGRNVFAGAVDQAAGQRLNEGVEQRRIIGRREHQMGAAGIRDQASAGAISALDQVLDFVFGCCQARGLHIAGVHRG